MKRVILVLIIFLQLQTILRSQVVITPPAISSYLITPTALISGFVTSLSDMDQVSVMAELSDLESGAIIMTVETNKFKLVSGNNSLGSKNLNLKVSYGRNAYADYVGIHHRLPSGNFNYCFTLFSNAIEELDKSCETIESQTEVFLNLLYPYDHDTIMTTYPTLYWLHSGDFNLPNQDFKLTLVEIKNGQSSQQAIRENLPVFTLSSLKTHSVAYPFSASRLVYGKSYAWQVELWEKGVAVVSSEVWVFHIATREPKDPLKYVKLRKNKNAGDYQVVDERVYYTFEDGNVTPEACKIQIFDRSGKRILPLDNIDESMMQQKETSKQHILDLGPFNLKKGTYLLKLINKAGEKFELNLYVE